MRFATRAFGLATIAALIATVVVFQPGSDPVEASAAQPAALPADLALVPADAVGFVHVRAADLWKNEALAPFRQIFEKAGPKVLDALETQFVPKISTFDRATAFMLLDNEDLPALPFLVLRFSAPFNPDDVLKAYLPNAQIENLGGKTVYNGKESPFSFYFPDKQHIVIGPNDGFGVLFTHKMPKTGSMSYALSLAAAGKPLVISVANISKLPITRGVLEDLPPDVKLLAKAEHITVSLDLGATAKVELVAGYKTAEEAQDAEKAIKALAELARKELAKVKDDLEKRFLGANGPRPAADLPEALFTVFGVGALNQLDELLANPGAFVKRDGTKLSASVTIPKEVITAIGAYAGVMVGFLVPAVQKVRAAAARMTSANNLKQIGLAIHNYHDTNGHFPQDIVDKNGKPLLSWRVAILSYIEQDNLYKQFKLDEPWDSANNKPLSQTAIKTFLSPRVITQNPGGKTHYKAFAGPGTAFEPGKKITLNDIADGTSNTIMLIETAEEIEWARPGDIPFDPKKPLPNLASALGDGMAIVSLCDASVRIVNLKTLSEKTLRAAITRDAGDILGDDWDK